MLNFTIGPVMCGEEVLKIGGSQIPYFRTPEFSNLILRSEEMVLELLNAPHGSKCVFLTTSGTGAMESCVMNVLNPKDRVIVINGGSFGQRFVDLCNIHGIYNTEVKCEFGKQLKIEQLEGLENHTALLVNMHETSSGLLYDMEMISDYCKDNNILLIIDAISSFIADELDMNRLNAAVVITGSQKALAVQPGVSLIALNDEAISRVLGNDEKSLYLSIKEALKDGKRGQTPYTPAVTTLMQINNRLTSIIKSGGVLNERERIISLAKDFRSGIENMPFDIVPEKQSNALTCLRTTNENAKEIVRVLKDEYNIWVCPNGGEYSDSVFRVGHIGHITRNAIHILIESLEDMQKRGL